MEHSIHLEKKRKEKKKMGVVNIGESVDFMIVLADNSVLGWSELKSKRTPSAEIHNFLVTYRIDYRFKQA